MHHRVDTRLRGIDKIRGVLRGQKRRALNFGSRLNLLYLVHLSFFRDFR